MWQTLAPRGAAPAAAMDQHTLLHDINITLLQHMWRQQWQNESRHPTAGGGPTGPRTNLSLADLLAVLQQHQQQHGGPGGGWGSPSAGGALVPRVVTALSILGDLFGIVSVLINILLVVSAHCVKDRSSAYLHYIQNLAVADIFGAITFLVTEHYPHWAFGLLADPESHLLLGHGLGYMFRSLPWLFFTSYLLTMCFLAVNQYVAVCRPMQYSLFSSPCAIHASLVLIWTVSSVQLLVPVFIFVSLLPHADADAAIQQLFASSQIDHHVWMGLYVFTIFINIVLNAVTRVRLMQLKKRQSAQTSPRAVSNPAAGQPGFDQNLISARQEALVTLTLLLLASILCRLPFPIISIVNLNLHAASTTTSSSDTMATAVGGTVGGDGSTVIIIESLMLFFLHSNFLVDPIIIICRTRDIRALFRTFFVVCRKRYRCCMTMRGAPGRQAGAAPGEDVNLVDR